MKVSSVFKITVRKKKRLLKRVRRPERFKEPDEKE